MKNVIKKLKVVLIIGMITVPIIGMITVPTILMAQAEEDATPPPVGGGGGAPSGGVADAPFDGGVSLLVAAGIAYGLKRKYDKKKTEKNFEIIEK